MRKIFLSLLILSNLLLSWDQLSTKGWLKQIKKDRIANIIFDESSTWQNYKGMGGNLYGHKNDKTIGFYADSQTNNYNISFNDVVRKTNEIGLTKYSVKTYDNGLAEFTWKWKTKKLNCTMRYDKGDPSRIERFNIYCGGK